MGLSDYYLVAEVSAVCSYICQNYESRLPIDKVTAVRVKLFWPKRGGMNNVCRLLPWRRRIALQAVATDAFSRHNTRSTHVLKRWNYWEPLASLLTRTATRSCRGPANAHFVSIHQVSSHAATPLHRSVCRPKLYGRSPCGHCCMPRRIDVKNINLQIKKHYKTCFFHFYKKTLNTCMKHLTTVSIQIRSTVNTNQIKSLMLLQSTRSVQEMESLPVRNASYLYFCALA